MQEVTLDRFKIDIHEKYMKELCNYFHPSSPLEMMQIERIAQCRTKLDELYELEAVNYSWLQENL